MRQKIIFSTVAIFAILAFGSQKLAAEQSLEKISTNLASSFYLDSKKTDNSAYAISQTTSLEFPGLKGKFSWKLPKTNFSSVPSFCNPTWNFSLDLKKQSEFYKKYPVRLDFGTLNASGSLSKMKNPALAKSASTFTKVSPKAQKLSAICASPSKSNAPISAFFGYDFSPFMGKKYALEFSLFTNEKNEFASGVYAQIPIGKKRMNILGFSETLGIFKFANENSGWFSASDYFPERFYFSSSSQASFSNKLKNAKAIFNLYENRHAQVDWTFSAENTLSFGFLSISSGYFYASNPWIFTSSGKNLKTLQNFFVNPYVSVYTFKNRLKIRLGFSGFYEDKVNSNGEKFSSLNFLSCFEGTTRLFLVKLSSQSKNLLIDNGNLSWKSATYSENLSIALLKTTSLKTSVNYSFTLPHESANFSSNLKVEISFASPAPINMTAKSSCTIKTEGEKTEFSSLQFSVAWKRKTPKMNIGIYTAFNCKF